MQHVPSALNPLDHVEWECVGMWRDDKAAKHGVTNVAGSHCQGRSCAAPCHEDAGLLLVPLPRRQIPGTGLCSAQPDRQVSEKQSCLYYMLQHRSAKAAMILTPSHEDQAACRYMYSSLIQPVLIDVMHAVPNQRVFWPSACLLSVTAVGLCQRCTPSVIQSNMPELLSLSDACDNALMS